MSFNATLYASNTDVLTGIATNKYPLIADVTAKTDVLSIDLSNLVGLFSTLEITSETKNLWSGGERITNSAKMAWNIETIPFAYSATETDILTDIKSILDKKFWWLDIKDYKYRPTELINVYTKLIAVNIKQLGWSAENGKKKITITCKERP